MDSKLLAQLLRRPQPFDLEATNAALRRQALADNAPSGSVGAPGGINFSQRTAAPMEFEDFMGALSFAPGIGDAAGLMGDAAMYATKPETRTPGNYALSAMGLLPFVPAATVNEKMAAAIRGMDNDWSFGNLPSGVPVNRREIAEKIRAQAEKLAEQFRASGFEVNLEHSGSRVGPSSYLTISDPQTGRAFRDPLRISDHSKGPFQSQFVVNIGSQEQADQAFAEAMKMRELGPTENFLASKERNAAKEQELIQIRLKNAQKKLRAGRNLSNAEKEALELYGPRD